MTRVRLRQGGHLVLGRELGAGGEARIFEIADDHTVVAKLYHEPTRDHMAKLEAMVERPPRDPTLGIYHRSIAWPTDLLLSDDRRPAFRGYLMPRIATGRPIVSVFNPSLRRRNVPLFSWAYLHRTARNLAAAAAALHEYGYVIGDVNESNILVTEAAMVSLVDTDSFQVRAPDGRLFRCPVAKPEYTPPELQGRNLKDFDREIEHDCFGLAVLFFQLLMEGTHPFAGRWAHHGEPPELGERIRAGHYPYAAGGRKPNRPMPFAPPIEILHPQLVDLFARAFVPAAETQADRPSMHDWLPGLTAAEEALITCSRNRQHRYQSHTRKCPWCARASALRGADPFPSSEAVARNEHVTKTAARPSPAPKPQTAFAPAFPGTGPGGTRRLATRPAPAYAGRLTRRNLLDNLKRTWRDLRASVRWTRRAMVATARFAVSPAAWIRTAREHKVLTAVFVLLVIHGVLDPFGVRGDETLRGFYESVATRRAFPYFLFIGVTSFIAVMLMSLFVNRNIKGAAVGCLVVLTAVGILPLGMVLFPLVVEDLHEQVVSLGGALAGRSPRPRPSLHGEVTPVTPPPTPTPRPTPWASLAPEPAAWLDRDWRELPPPPRALRDSVAAVLQGRLYLVGGCTGIGRNHFCSSSVFRLDPEAGTWRQLADLPQARAGARAIAPGDGQLYLIGGSSRPYALGFAAEAGVWAYAPAHDRWFQRAPMPRARTEFLAIARAGRIYCLGGIARNQQLRDVDVYDPQTDRWSTLGALPVESNDPLGGFTNAGHLVAWPASPQRGRANQCFVWPADHAGWVVLPMEPIPFVGRWVANRGTAQLYLGTWGHKADARAVVLLALDLERHMLARSHTIDVGAGDRVHADAVRVAGGLAEGALFVTSSEKTLIASVIGLDVPTSSAAVVADSFAEGLLDAGGDAIEEPHD